MRSEETRDFLNLVFGDIEGLIEVRSMAPDLAGAEQTFHETIEGALLSLDDSSRRERNIYVGVATRRSNESGSKANLAAARCLYVDIDFKKPTDLEALEEQIKTFSHPPSMRVWSGGGVHLYWRLDDAFDLRTIDSIQRFEAVLKGLCQSFGGDRAATDASRILRVPGTINYPDSRKRAKGRVPTACRLLRVDHGI